MGYISYNRRRRSRSGEHYERAPMEDWILAREQDPELTIVSREQWYLVQKLREDRRRLMRDAAGRERGDYPASSGGTLALMGLLYCGYCGRRLTNGSKYDYWTTKSGERKKKITGRYRCAGRAEGAQGCEGRAYYRADEVEGAVFSAVAEYLEQLGAYDVRGEILALREAQESRLKRRKEALTKEAQEVERDIGTLRQRIPAALRGEGVFGAETLAELTEEKRGRLSAIGRELEELESACRDVESVREEIDGSGCVISGADWGALFLECDIAEKKALLAKLTERIDIWEEDIRISFRTGRADPEPGIGSVPPTTPYIHGSARRT